MKLIVGLGNPGLLYAKNRHNLGLMCLQYFAKKHGIKLEKKQGPAKIGSGTIDGVEVVLARPQTYMNESGLAVVPLVNKFQLNLDGLIIIHDDLDLPVGRMRLRQDGGSGGHKGIESITAGLDSPDFIRIRVGIGRPVLSEGTRASENDIKDYVLSNFTREEQPVVDEVVPRVSEALETLLKDGLAVAMNRYNREPDRQIEDSSNCDLQP